MPQQDLNEYRNNTFASWQFIREQSTSVKYSGPGVQTVTTEFSINLNDKTTLTVV